MEDKYKPESKVKQQTDEKDLDLTGLISDDVALAVRAELMRYSDVFDTDDTKDIIYRSVTNATREMVREWLDQNLASIAKEVINEALQKNNLTKNDIKLLIPHQANLRIIKAAAKKLSLPLEQVVVTVDDHANTSAASIPLALNEAVKDGRIKEDQVLLLEAFGSGFTWGSVLLRY
mgnify:CR=1 FL=1